MAVGNLELITKVTASSVSSFDVDNIFSSKYDVYQLEFFGGSASTQSNEIYLRLMNSSGVVTTSTYDYAEDRSESASQFQRFLYLNISDYGTSATLNVFNPNDSSSYTFVKWQSSVFGTVNVGRKGIGVEHTAQTITGINLLSNGTNVMDSLTVSVYGLASN
jgi:hypothetical protein